jgi:hypothetical protein
MEEGTCCQWIHDRHVYVTIMYNWLRTEASLKKLFLDQFNNAVTHSKDVLDRCIYHFDVDVPIWSVRARNVNIWRFHFQIKSRNCYDCVRALAIMVTLVKRRWDDPWCLRDLSRLCPFFPPVNFLVISQQIFCGIWSQREAKPRAAGLAARHACQNFLQFSN